MNINLNVETRNAHGSEVVIVTVRSGHKVFEQRYQRCKEGWARISRSSRIIH